MQKQKQGAQKGERIEFRLPSAPHTLRAFIEKTVRDERAFRIFTESPVKTLVSAGVPISEKALTEEDCVRLIDVIDGLRVLVEGKKLAKDFQFEEVFKVEKESIYKTSRSSKTKTCCHTEFDSSHHSSHTRTRSHYRRDKKFHVNGEMWEKIDGIIRAPLFDLGPVIKSMEEQIDAMFQ